VVCPGDPTFGSLVDPNGPQKTVITIGSGASTRGTDAFGENPKNVPVGNTVVWVNQDSITHTVTSTPDGALFDSGNIAPGCAWSRKFDNRGSFPYFCRIHPNMNGTLSVN
jgi:plastocyanin